MTGPSTNSGVGEAPPPSSIARAAFLALSTSGWSNGLIPMIRPATAVAYSHSSSWAPSGASTETPKPDAGRTSPRTGSGPNVPSTSSGVLGAKLGESGAVDHDRQDALAVLAGGLGDELLGPVAETGVRRTRVRRARACRRRRGWRPRAAPPRRRPGVVDRVGLEGGPDGLGLVEQPGDVGAGQPAGHQPEGGERGVAAADGRVGQEHPVAGLARRLLQRRAGVGDDDDPLGRVDAGVGERLLEGALLAVGLDGAAGLAGHHDDGLGEPVLERRAHEVGVGGVEDDELDAGRPADHLGRERGAAHAAEHDPGQAPLAQLHLERRDLGDQRARGLREGDPGEPLAGLVLGLRSPQGLVLGGDPAGDPVGDQLFDGAGQGTLVGIAEEELERRSGS